MRNLNPIALGTLSVAILALSPITPYPIDGYEETGIRRLLRLQRIVSGELKEARPIAGAMKSIEEIDLMLKGRSFGSLDNIEQDQAFAQSVNSIFPGLHASYSIAVLDVTAGRPARYAERKGTTGYQPGSVGKIAVAVAFLAEIARIHPDSFEARRRLMRSKMVRAGIWAMTDSHTVPFYDPDTGNFFKRTVRDDDVFSLYEWLDHMMSVSNNGAASIVWREAVLMRVFGSDYPGLTEQAAADYFRTTPKSDLSELAVTVVNEPLRAIGIGEDEWRLGSFFTRGAGSIIPGRGGSTGTTRGLMKFLVEMESGRVIDVESSLELKRLMYMTDRRIRYAAAPVLAEAAVYFKSGSLYSCQEEEGYTCTKYMGNKRNFMNSVAIVEHPDGTTYFVVLMSNVLKKNSASDHLELATKVDRLVRSG